MQPQVYKSPAHTLFELRCNVALEAARIGRIKLKAAEIKLTEGNKEAQMLLKKQKKAARRKLENQRYYKKNKARLLKESNIRNKKNYSTEEKREKIRKRHRIYYHANKEKCTAIQKRYTTKHKVKLAAKAKDRYIQNREKRKRYQLAYYYAKKAEKAVG